MKSFFLLALLAGMTCVCGTPTLHFDDRVTWKQIFDSGFRPKHLKGLESHKCVCNKQDFFLQFKNRNQKFKLGIGTIDFGFFYDDFLQMIWHQGADPITLEEGKLQADEFRNLFNGYIVQEITMPRLIDPSGLVDAGNDEKNVKARVGEYLIWYGFDNSMGKTKPIIPHFYIVWNFPGRPDVRLKDARDVVRPPKGYEWYSLDPKVNTPDPSSVSAISTEPEIKDPEKNAPPLPNIEVTHTKNEVFVTLWTRLGWIAGLLLVFLIGAGIVIRIFGTRKK